ncbi:MAG: twin-arginine translocase subunit TatC [bacterium]
MSDTQLTVVEHLTELRKRIIICLVSITAGAGLSYFFIQQIFDFIIKPVGKLVFISPQEAFVSYVKIAFISGIFLSLPIVLFQLWQFVSAALTVREKKYVFYFAPFSLMLFLGGAVFGYMVILPLGLRFLLGFAAETLTPMITMSKYVSFAGLLVLAFGVVFELPLVIMFLTKIRIITPQLLIKHRKYSILIIFIIAALLTPPDVVTQCLMAGPLMVLYEISILLSKLMQNRNRGRC